MAYGDLIGAEPIDLGNGVPAYNFVSRGGQKTMLWGPEAEQLKARLDASETMMPRKVAGPGTGAPDATPPRMGQTEMLTGPPPLPPGVAEVPTGKGDVVRLPEPMPVQSNGDVVSPPQQQQQPQGPVPIGMRSRLVPNPMGGPPIMETYHPGSRGVSQEDWQRKRAQTTMMPTGSRTTVEGAVPPDPDFIEGMRDVAIDRRLALQSAADRAMATAAQERELVKAQYERETAAVQEQLRLKQLTEQRVQEFEQTKDRLRADANSATVDSKRLFSGETGALRTIGGAIAAAMGQYGAAMTHSPNAALAIINKAVDDDIRSQELEIQTKKEAAGNALSEYLREGLNLDQAKLVLKQNMLDQAASQRRLISLTNAPQEIQAWEAQMQTAETENLLKFEEEYRRASIGRTTEEIASSARYPQAGSAGGWAQSTPGEVKATMDATKAMRVAYGDMQSGKGGSNVTVRNLQSALGEMEQINNRVAQMDPNKTVPGYANQNMFTRAWWNVQDWVGGEGTHLSGLNEKDRAEYELFMQARNSALFSLSQGRGQGVVRESELKLSMQELLSAKTWGAVQRIRQHQTNALNARLQALQSGKSADQAFEANPLTLSTGSATEVEVEPQ